MPGVLEGGSLHSPNVNFIKRITTMLWKMLKDIFLASAIVFGKSNSQHIEHEKHVKI